MKVSTRLTVGSLVYPTAPNFRGQVRLNVVVGPSNILFPAGSPNGNYFSDVRCEASYTTGAGAPVCTAPGSANNLTSTGAPTAPRDYTGALNVFIPFRWTDEANSGPSGGPYNQDATIGDFNFTLAFDCAVTIPATIGATCLPRHVSGNALCGCLPSGKRLNGEVGATPPGGSTLTGGIYAMDGGNDGVVADLVPDTDGPLVFARQGIFLP